MLYLPEEDGQGLVEYGLVLVLIAFIVAAAVTLLGPAIADMYSTIVAGI